ncbi:MAG: carboxypeptidase-like regulatory domain-containing protein [Candidatus Acidiferrales bacterium]
MRRKIACVLAISLLATFNAVGRPYTGKIAGTVVGTNDRPVVDAQVIIERSDGSLPIATHTNSSGQYLVKSIPAGYYDIRASRGSTASVWKHNVIVKSGKITEVNLRLHHITAPKQAPTPPRS